MITRRKFNRIKRENPESRIWQRTREEQRIRDRIAAIIIKARKKWVETPYSEYRERLTNEKQKIEWEKNIILKEIEDLVQKKEKDSQQIEKNVADFKQQKEQEKNRLLLEIEKVKQQYKETTWELNEIKHKKPYEIIEHLEQNLDSLTYPEMLKALDLLKNLLEKVIKQNRPNNFEELKWNPDKVIADLEENHMKVDDENVEMYWYKGKIVHVELPSVWWFKWDKFDYFISDEVINIDDYKKIKWTINYHTERSFWKFLNNLNKYMQQFWIELDTQKVYVWWWQEVREDYVYGIDYRYSHKNWCEIWRYVEKLLYWYIGHCRLGDDMLFMWDDFCFDAAWSVGVYWWHIMAHVDWDADKTYQGQQQKKESLVDVLSRIEWSSQTFGELNQSMQKIIDK